MTIRKLPVRPNLDQLKRQAKELLEAMHAGDPDAVAELHEHLPAKDASVATLADAQHVLARSYQALRWTRLSIAARLAEAIWNDDMETVRDLVMRDPALLREPVVIRNDSSWGAPMAFAANLGRDAMIRMLHALGATDLEHAAARAALQGHPATTRMIYELAGSPPIHKDALGGPAYTLNVDGTAVLLSLGAPLRDADGKSRAPIDVVLQTDGRNPASKHAILEMYAQRGVELPNTPTMALHRGRIDLLEQHLARDSHLLSRRFTHREFFPAEVGCRDARDATIGTPLDGATLLHMAIEYDEMEIARWLLDKGMDVNITASVGATGFGGFTPLFSTVVSMPNFWMNYNRRGPFAAPFTELLLERGADPNARASIWKRLNEGHDRTMTRHDYRDVTPLSYGRRFHDQIFVSGPALKWIADAGGHA